MVGWLMRLMWSVRWPALIMCLMIAGAPPTDAHLTHPPPNSFDPRTTQYAPHGKDWIKQKAFEHLKSMASGGAPQQQGGRRR